jgi:hypothetical protein
MYSSSGSTDISAPTTFSSTAPSSHTKTQYALQSSSQGQGLSTTSTARSSTRQSSSFSDSESVDLFRRIGPVTRRQDVFECPETTNITVTIKTTLTITVLPPAGTRYTIEVSSQVPKRSLFYPDGCTSVHSADAFSTCTSHVTSLPLQPSSRVAPASSNVAGRRYVAPLAWDNLRRWVMGTQQHLRASSTATPTYVTGRGNDAIEQLLNSASTNAAMPHVAIPLRFRRDTVSAPITTTAISATVPSIPGAPTPMSTTYPRLSGPFFNSTSDVTCPPTISQISFTAPPTWSAPVITAYLAQPSAPKYLGLSSYGISPKVGIPCGYTNISNPHLIVPATTFTGDIGFYSGIEAYDKPPGCDQGILKHNEEAVAIGWEIYDFGRASGALWPNNSFCGRKLKAWCDDPEGGAERQMVLYVRDRCAGCRPQDPDVLEGAFGMCANSGVGRAHVRWKWIEYSAGKGE